MEWNAMTVELVQDSGRRITVITKLDHFLFKGLSIELQLFPKHNDE